MFKIIFY